MRIEHTEYEARQAAARKLAQELGFSALVAWSRGGSTQDHYADVYYLTGFYTHQPFIPDEPGRWRAHGHTALVLPVDGPSTLLVDMTEVQDPKPAADRVRVTEDLVESLATTVTDTVPPGTDVALLGASTYARHRGPLREMMGGTWGHSLGLDWGAPWIESACSTVIQPGMCFAIERRIEAPGIGGANYENDVIVTDAGPEIVTPAPDRYDE